MSASIVVESPFFKSSCTLGEGPLYDPSTGILHFVDILKCQVLHLNPVTFELSVDQFKEPVSCLSLRRNGEGLACAASEGFAIFQPGTPELHYLSKPLPPEHAGRVRFNDGACDADGRFFAGTIRNKEHNIPGQLYCYDPSTREATLVDPGPFTDSNGLGWSPNQKTLYFTDSLVNHIHAYDYENGQLTNRRLFFDGLASGLAEGTYPDGLCIDSEGYIWSARWGGSRITRLTPDGKIDLEVRFPTALNITACCFGGPSNDQLFVTTAHCGAIGGDASLQESFPDSGHIFKVDLSNQFKGGPWRFEFAG